MTPLFALLQATSVEPLPEEAATTAAELAVATAQRRQRWVRTIDLAGLIFTGVIDIAGDARPMVGGVLGTVAALDLVLAVYFIVSEPS